MSDGHELWTFGEESAPIGIGALTLVDGASFAICDHRGEMPSTSGRAIWGLFVADTRVCSRLYVSIDDQPIEPLTATMPSTGAASFVGRSADRAFLLRRDLWVGRGMRIDLRLRNLTLANNDADLRLALATDLAEIFAVKEGRADTVPLVPLVGADGEALLQFADPAANRGLIARANGRPLVTRDGSFRWHVDLEPGGTWTACIELSPLRGGEAVEPRHSCGQPPDLTRQTCWKGRLPRLHSDVPGLGQAFARSSEDLAGLRLFDPDHPGEAIIAAGAPWYMTLFGRDSILTSWMALLFDPTLGLSTLRALGRLQGTRDVADTEEQPGRILHEVRFSRKASLALADGDVYYGSVDATPLYVLLAHELWRWGVPLEDLRPLLPAVDAALDWLAGPGDVDGDGYVEYEARTPDGLVNQGWKDSFDGVSWADGRLPDPPLALAEVQAYVYAAWRAGAALATATGDHIRAAVHEARAMRLQEKFEADFWLPDRRAFAVALDRDKRPVDAVASNMGHLLWAGIVTDPEQAAAVARWLVSPELYSGWGVRTLATSMGRYNPLSYHNGSVWPHDTAIAVAGLRKAGFLSEALQLASGLLSAAEVSGGRLPELFAGLTPDDFTTPVPYPTSCSPQAWASAAPLLLVRVLLGLEPNVPEGRIELDPVLPAGATSLRVEELPLAGARVTIDIDDGAVAVHGLPRGLALIRPAA